MIQSENGLLV